MCTYCKSSEEIISHLYFSCHKVQSFLHEARIWLHTLNINIPYEASKVIFGIHVEGSNGQSNYLLLLIKQYYMEEQGWTRWSLIFR